MTLPSHRVRPPLFDAIATGGGGAEAMSVLTEAQYSKHLMLLEGVLDQARACHHDQWPFADRGYEFLADAQGRDPVAASRVISHSSVGAWAIRTLRALGGGSASSGAEPGALCAVAASAAIQACLPGQIAVPVINGAVMLPALGAATADGSQALVRSSGAGAAEVVSQSHRVAVPADPHQDGPGWAGLRRVKAGPLDALVDDLDPFRMPAAPHVAPRLSSDQTRTWAAALQEAWPVLDQHHPSVAPEIAAAVKVIVPLQAPAEGINSSSTPETFGAIAMSQPSERRLLAMTLTHEVQHMKLSALHDVEPLIQPDERRFYAPWRDDPRPIDGLLQGTYAFFGVSGFWRRQRHHEEGAAEIQAHVEYVRWRDAAALTTGTLKRSGSLTPAGMKLVHGISQTLNAWQAADRVPEEASQLALRDAREHRRCWQRANGPIPA
jgi:uncharacterized protein